MFVIGVFQNNKLDKVIFGLGVGWNKADLSGIGT